MKIFKIFKNKKYLLILILILAILGWIIYSKFLIPNNNPKYVLGNVSRGKIEIFVSGSGFVSPISKVDLKSKVSAEVLGVMVKEGQRVRAGDLIIKLDDSDALKNIRDAELTLETAKLALEKLKKQYEENLRADNLNKNYEDGMSILSELYSNYPTILNGLNNVLFSRDFNSEDINNIEYYSSYNDKFKNLPKTSENLYNELKSYYNEAFNDFNLAKRGGGPERQKAIQGGYNLISKTAQLIKIGLDAVLNLQNQIVIGGAIHKYKAIIDNHFSSLTDYSAKVDNYLKNILIIVNNINSLNDSLSNYPLDIKNQELNVLARQNALADAKDKLNDYYIRAPFDGIITNILVKAGDTISGGVIATLITDDKIAEVSLNEVDAAQVKIGQDAILTFDALPNVSLKGKVVEISTIGTESQGVVSYGIKISFEDKNQEIKPGMSVTAKIIANFKDNVLLVPNLAIKTFSGNKYVDKPFDKISQDKVSISIRGGITLSSTTRQIIKTGLANDEFSEVLEGLEEGDIIILRTINSNSSQSLGQGNFSGQNRPVSQSSAIFRFPGTGGR